MYAESTVTAIVEHFGSKPQDHGIVVAFGGREPFFTPLGTTVYPKGAVEFWDAARGWTALNDYQFDYGVTAMSAYGAGVAVGLRNGPVYYWDGTVGAGSGWTELKGTGWGQEVTALLPYKQGLIVGLGGQTFGFDPERAEGTELTPTKNPGLVEYYTGGTNFKSGKWIELHGTQWGSGVTKMIPYR